MLENQNKNVEIHLQTISLGNTFEVESGTVLLVIGSNNSNGFNVNIADVTNLNNDISIPGYLLIIKRTDNGQIILGKAEEDVESDKGKYEVEIEKTRGQLENIEDGKELKLTVGMDVQNIAVHDKEEKNGFILKVVGDNRFKLAGILTNGRWNKSS
jgi:hypothetical protein